jgi:hypothetical protein
MLLLLMWRQEADVAQPEQTASDSATYALASAGEPATGSYLIPKEKRVRDLAHLAFVAS